MRKFSDSTQKKFDQFVQHANKTLLHPYDWKRFYLFIRQCHSERIKIKESDLTDWLVDAGFSPEMAGNLYSVYSHCRAILKLC